MGAHDEPQDDHARPSRPRRAKPTARRSVLRGAMWSVPALAASTAPTFAYSCEKERVEVQAIIPAEMTTDRRHGPRVETRHRIPAGVTSITVEVLGGGGGCGAYAKASQGGGGGDGHLVRGTLAVRPGDELLLIAGNGGSGPDALGQDANVGGEGYGAGGESPAGQATRAFLNGGSGGGGSAILVGGVPVVVAGGGGGVGAVLAVPTPGWTFTGGSAGDAQSAGADVRIRRPGEPLDEKVQAGGGASESVPGAPRGIPVVGGDASNGWERVNGFAGSAPEAGGHGAGGVVSAAYELDGAGTLRIASGGGGGGYAGGASGEAAARVHDGPSGTGFQYAVGAPGGGGSSYLSPAVTDGSVGFGTNGSDDGTRGPGFVRIHYDIPC